MPLLVREKQDSELLYGYLMDVMNAVKFVVYLEPSFRSYIEENLYMQWQRHVFSFAASQIGEKMGIPDLCVRTVWIGNGLVGNIWALPDRLLPTIISREDELNFEKLKKFFGNREPSVFYAYGDEEPIDMKNSTVTPDIAEVSLDRVIDAFTNDAKAVMKELLSESWS